MARTAKFNPFKVTIIFYIFCYRLLRESDRACKKQREMKEKIEKVCSGNDAAASEFRSFNQQTDVRPRKEVDQPKLRIVEASSAADDRHRCEHLCSIKTLDDLHNEIARLGFKMSRSATFEVDTTTIRLS